MTFPPPIRLFADIAVRGQLSDLNTGMPAKFYRGDDVEIDIGIGLNGSLLTALGNVAWVTCQLFKSEIDPSAPMMSCTVLAAAMTLSLTQANWTANAGCHAAFVFPNIQTDIPLGGAPLANYWLRITVTTTDAPAKIFTLADGIILVCDGPLAVGLSAPITPGYKIVTDGNGLNQIAQQASDSHYYVIRILNNAGVLTPYVDPTPF
jgi:hypothetical protein